MPMCPLQNQDTKIKIQAEADILKGFAGVLPGTIAVLNGISLTLRLKKSEDTCQ
jgi:hypothetical protein